MVNGFKFNFLQTKRLRDKRKSRKGESFGQCIKINYDMLHMPSFAFVVSGSNEGVVNKDSEY